MLLILPKYTRINSCQFIVGKRTENVGFGLNAYDLRPVSTQENKHRIGLDFFPSCIIHTAGPKNVENTSTLYHPGLRITGSNWTENWYRKPNMRGFNFEFRSDAYFPEWKSAFMFNICTHGFR